MDKETEDRLNELLKSHEEDQKQLEQRRAAAAEKAAAERAEAARFVAEQLLPVLEQFTERLKAQGHDAYAYSRGDGPTGEIHFFPKSARKEAGPDRPYLKFLVSADVVHIEGSNMLPNRGGTSGPRGKVERADFTPGLIEAEVIKWLDEVLRGPWH